MTLTSRASAATASCASSAPGPHSSSSSVGTSPKFQAGYLLDSSALDRRLALSSRPLISRLG
jgi:hypothetical protein